MALHHFNTKAGSQPYRNLFSNITSVPADTGIAYISTQWAGDPATGEVYAGMEGDYYAQTKVIWENITKMLKEMGLTNKDIIHKELSFLDFNDEIGKICCDAVIAATPEEWKADIFVSSLKFNRPAGFHRPGIVYTVDLIVATHK